MRHISLFATVIILAVLIASCAKDMERGRDDSSAPICFTVTQSGELEAAGTKGALEDGTFKLTSDDGFSLPVLCESSFMELNLGDYATKGQCFNAESEFTGEKFGVYCWEPDGTELYTSEEVSYDSDAKKWKPVTAKYWPYKASMTFIAVYPKDGCTFSDIKPDNMDFTYTTKACAADQKDLMLAYYSGTGSNGTASLEFTHALTCVNFSAGSLDGVDSIDEISLVSVYAGGTCAVTEATPPTYTWTPSGSTTVTSSGVVAKADFGNLESNAGYNFLLVPQNLGTQNVTLNVKMTINGIQMTFKKKIDEKVIAKWEEGKKCTFKLGYYDDISISVDDNATGNTKDNLSICNTGKVSVYFRVALVGDWRTEQGIIMSGWDESQGTFTDFPGTNWEKIGDYYYYKYPVNAAENESTPTEITDLLFSKYVAPSTPPAEGTVLNLNVSVQAVRYDQEKTMVAEAWGEDVAAKLNTK